MLLAAGAETTICNDGKVNGVQFSGNTEGKKSSDGAENITLPLLQSM